eukprot:scaffold32614_cov69-Phaeocystis_antarctica.AAC.4
MSRETLRTAQLCRGRCCTRAVPPDTADGRTRGGPSPCTTPLPRCRGRAGGGGAAAGLVARTEAGECHDVSGGADGRVAVAQCDGGAARLARRVASEQGAHVREDLLVAELAEGEGAAGRRDATRV